MPGINDEESYEEGGYPMLFDENNTWGRNRKDPEPPKPEKSSDQDSFLFIVLIVFAGIVFLFLLDKMKGTPFTDEVWLFVCLTPMVLSTILVLILNTIISRFKSKKEKRDSWN